MALDLAALPPAWPAPCLLAAEADELTLSEWAELLDVSRNALYKRAPQQHAGMRQVNGLLTRTYKLAMLPADYHGRLRDLLHRSNCQSFSDVLMLRARNEQRWQPDFEFGAKTANQQERALMRQQVLRVYFAMLGSGKSQREANVRACAQWLVCFGEACNEKTIRRWAKKIDECGGIELAPLEAYCDRKDVPHPGARLENRGQVPVELIAEFRARCVSDGMEHMKAAWRSLHMDWLAGKEVPGLGSTEPCVSLASTPFPVPFERLRKFAPSTPARRMGSHGKARARREALPHVRSTRAFLYYGEEYVLDDSRGDVIALDDQTGQPVEIRFYLCMEVASRRIVGWVMRQTAVGASGAIRATDVDELIARVLSTSGLAAAGAGYCTRMKLERGTVACTPARQSMLEGLFPGRLVISRTGMDGGKNHPGDVSQASSGHWMGKGVIESFMRTLSYYLQHLPGQRGGDYRRQPAQLGLKGRGEDGMLAYHAGSLIHESARGAYAEKALALLPTDSQLATAQLETVGQRFRVRTLRNVSWVRDAVLQTIAYYNATTDHRREGYQTIEVQDARGALVRRQESANERAARLYQQTPTERISDADASLMLTHSARRITVRQNGVTLSIAGQPGWHFYSEHSVACSEAARNATLQKDYVALIDEGAFETWDGLTPLSIYLLSDSVTKWKPGMAGRFLEALPLRTAVPRNDPEAVAAALERSKAVEARYQREVLHAAGPRLAADQAATAANVRHLEGAVSMIREAVRPAVESQLAQELAQARAARATQPATAAPTRTAQKVSAMDRYAALLASRQQS